MLFFKLCEANIIIWFNYDMMPIRIKSRPIVIFVDFQSCTMHIFIDPLNMDASLKK